MPTAEGGPAAAVTAAADQGRQRGHDAVFDGSGRQNVPRATVARVARFEPRTSIGASIGRHDIAHQSRIQGQMKRVDAKFWVYKLWAIAIRIDIDRFDPKGK